MSYLTLATGWQYIDKAELGWWPELLSVDRADYWQQQILRAIELQPGYVQVFGKRHLIPRLQAWFGPKDYRYSGETLAAAPMPHLLQPLLALCQQVSGTSFNSVLINYYRDGQDYMGWHSDNEPELGDNPLIASLSFGALRDFDLRNRNTQQRIRVALNHGSLLVMAGDCQRHWQHALPKRLRQSDPRLNLTFRYVF